MSDPGAAQPSEEGLRVIEGAGGGELTVLEGSSVAAPQASLRALARERRAGQGMIPAVQAAAVAAGGFVAGAAVVGLVHRRQRNAAALAPGRRRGRELARGGRGRGGAIRPGELMIVTSRSLLVDVHLLGRPGTDA